MTARTKIVATIGPASDDADVLGALIDAGVDVVRLNLSHGTLDGHLERIARVRSVAAGRPVAVLADLPGPKIRAGAFPEGGTYLAAGDVVTLAVGDDASDGDRITVPYPTLLEDLEVGSRVQLGDGAIALRVVGVDDAGAVAVVETGGEANGRPGVHLSSRSLRMPSPTANDLVLADAVAAAGVEFIAVSFVRRADDVEKVREVVGSRAQLVSKIETSAAIDQLHEIIAASDAVMVARGDLGIDCPIEDVPHLQKRIVRHCVEAGVPVITATQMLESMITAPSPTRAEVSDVANAVFDGSDALMLSGETAIGRDPVGVIRTMGVVAERAESEAAYRQWANRLGRVQRLPHHEEMSSIDPITAAITHAASQATHDVELAAILCCTRSGRTARAMARFRPAARMIGLSPNPDVVRSMALIWGVVPLEVDVYGTTDEMVWFAVETALRAGLITTGETVAVLAGAPDPDRPRPPDAATDVLRIVRVD
ncbi:MAG TPA: pyruvate kinase [Ilumatobacteraceae bacterium]|jgi:pyruvate kinase|nr:pyruvate kinase [Ilumatobacteraceae bacterium]